MADFDASQNRGISMINYTSTSTFFIARWSNVRLKHCSEREFGIFYLLPDFPVGEFSFSVCLFENGSIVFAYDKVRFEYVRLM
ncbi:unnamed protein product [Hydatigera taeniaeformis]|uniref:GOLD domain-containing protein n=1 Tax=Hydatigena taeniaeformis TaxID=6205 RepID=A0A0R3WWK6_HYDTA|nr:unnamed protein product [Hydatigera taeniaeformis]